MDQPGAATRSRKLRKLPPVVLKGYLRPKSDPVVDQAEDTDRNDGDMGDVAKVCGIANQRGQVIVYQRVSDRWLAANRYR